MTAISVALAALALALAGCGRFNFTLHGDHDGDVIDGPTDGPGDGPIANDPDGFWQLVEGRVTGESTVRLRSDLQNGIRGDVAIAAGRLQQRHLVLADGVEQSRSTGVSTLTYDGDHWIAEGGGVTAGLTAQWSGPDDVVLVWDRSDSANVGIPALDRLRIVRASPPPARLIGGRAVTRVAYQGLPEFPAGTCGPDVEGRSQAVVGAVDVTDQLLVSLDFNFQFFDTPDCSGPSTALEDVGNGYLEVEGSRYRLWLSIEGYDRVAMAGTVAFTASSTRFTRDSCVPSASQGCMDFPLATETSP